MSDNITESMREKWKHKCEVIIESIDCNQLKLNDWEERFMDSIDDKLSKGKDLSFKQSKCLRKIFDKIA